MSYDDGDDGLLCLVTGGRKSVLPRIIPVWAANLVGMQVDPQSGGSVVGGVFLRTDSGERD